MKPLLALLAALLVSACGTVPPTSTSMAQAPAAPAASQPAPQPVAQQYPAWLEMKPGYETACINGGGCVPMTQAELQQMAADIIQRTMQVCRRTSI